MEFIKESKKVNEQIDQYLLHVPDGSKRQRKSIVKKFLSYCKKAEKPNIDDYLHFLNEEECKNNNAKLVYVYSTVVRQYLAIVHGIDAPRINRKQLTNNNPKNNKKIWKTNNQKP